MFVKVMRNELIIFFLNILILGNLTILKFHVAAIGKLNP